MKKIFTFLLIAFFTLPGLSQSKLEIKPRLSPLTKKYLKDISDPRAGEKPPAGYLYKRGSDGKLYVSALIKVVDKSAVETKLKALGAKIGTKAGNVWTVQVPYEKMPDFCQTTGISYIQMDEPAKKHLDQARKTTRVDSVHSGINLPMRYSGKGVVVGIVDFGFDYNHPSFYDTLHAKYRIKRVWEMGTAGTPPAGYTYGHEITDTSLIKSQGTDNNKQTHGTWVAGMAAGSGYGGNFNHRRYRGMAYEADMAMVSVRRDSIEGQWLEGSFTDFIDGVNYLYTYAQSVGKPCVVNVSWGSQSGPHDGSTLLNSALNNLTGPGKVLVMSAGNEGQEKIHLSKTFTQTDTVLNTFLAFSPGANYKRTWVDVWGDSNKTFCGKVTLYNGTAGATTTFKCIDDNIHDTILISSNGLDTCFVQFISSSAESNGKPRMTIDIYSKVLDSINVSLKGSSGTINAWNEYYYYGYKYKFQSSFTNFSKPWATMGDVNTTVSDMGAGDSTLLVGAYASKVNFTDITGSSWTYASYVGAGQLVPFSSRGPMIGGKVKPDITSPGLTIATSVSSYDTSYTATGSNKQLTSSGYLDNALNKKFYYSEFTGTSASAPAASGIIALLLQCKPDLGPKEVNEIITTTAIQDIYTGTLPSTGDNNWGHGKINAYGAMKETYHRVWVGIRSYAGEILDCDLFPNPGNGQYTVRYDTDKGRDLKLEVYSMTGSLLKSEGWKTVTGSNQYALDLSNMPGGVYLVRLSSPEGFVSIKTVKN
ncbi:MAG: S8 family peptidase [Bacteroidia bacterium]|nr:S8 family peptidase [Bacteroidia bacterium]